MAFAISFELAVVGPFQAERIISDLLLATVLTNVKIAFDTAVEVQLFELFKCDCAGFTGIATY